MNQDHIRNFAIIAHIDHGKSTLADRLMEMTGTVKHRDMQEQLLDSNPIERERGITIKLAPVRMIYSYLDLRSSVIDRRNTEIQEILSPKIQDLGSKTYILNLIDTPGHVDFGYEVSRSLAACEGAVLVVDATQGVQAQTLANLHQAQLNHLKIIPVINKIDMPHARIEETKQELYDLGFPQDEIIPISAKTGANVEAVLEAIVKRIPAPKGNPDRQLRALVFSSQYDTHKGVVVFVRVVDGSIGSNFALRSPSPTEFFSTPRANENIKLHFLNSKADVAPIEVGYFNPKMVSSGELLTGEVGYIATGLKNVKLANVGDTITVHSSSSIVHSKTEKNTRLSTMNNELSTIQPLAGYREPKPMVFVGLFPIEQEEFTKSREAMEKLRLSDSAFTFRPISSLALGNGFHCGFLGLLHAEVVQERLSREFDLSLLATAPSVEYRLRLKEGVNPGKAGLVHSSSVFVHSKEEKLSVDNESQTTNSKSSSMNHELRTMNFFSIQSASEFPDPTVIEEVQEPVMQVAVYTPKRYIGAIMQLATEKRGAYIDLKYVGETAEFIYIIPLSEMIVDFFDHLKSVTEGYASLDYEFFEYQRADVVKVDILVNHEHVDALSFLIVKEEARKRGKEIVERLSEVLPRQQFSIPVQAAIGGEIIARDDIKPFRKDVIAKLYGGDRTRKDKLLKKQKRGKSKMKMIGSVEIPQSAFFEVLKTR